MRVPHYSALLFDLGGTHLRSACLDPSRKLTNFRLERIRSVRDGLSPSEVWSELLLRISGYARTFDRAVARSAPLVISFPGPLYEDGRIVNAPTVSGLDDQIPDLRKNLSMATGREVHILNDVTAAALYLARDCHWKRFMVVTVSSGIGTKVCVREPDKLLLFDKGPYAGELGHVPVDESSDAPTCDCGGKGHLGAISSGRGIEQLARRRALVDSHAFSQSRCHTQFGATASTLNNELHLVPAIHSSDEWSLRVLWKGTEPLAMVLHTVMLGLGLEGVFIIGGFAFSLGQRYIDLVREMIRNRCDYSAFRFTPDMICFGNFCEKACLLGAAEYALKVSDGQL